MNDLLALCKFNQILVSRIMTALKIQLKYISLNERQECPKVCNHIALIGIDCGKQLVKCIPIIFNTN